MLETPVLAAAGGPAGPGLIMQIAPLLLIFVIFYFLLIRPQQRRMREHREMVDKLRRGDVVVTAGGLVGKVIRVQDAEATVEIADNVRVKLIKSTIQEVRAKTEPAPAAPANDGDGGDADG